MEIDQHNSFEEKPDRINELMNKMSSIRSKMYWDREEWEDGEGVGEGTYDGYKYTVSEEKRGTYWELIIVIDLSLG